MVLSGQMCLKPSLHQAKLHCRCTAQLIQLITDKLAASIGSPTIFVNHLKRMCLCKGCSDQMCYSNGKPQRSKTASDAPFGSASSCCAA
eukprot:scaffold55253_cov23-Tisochrysis_lutea.AAC.3